MTRTIPHHPIGTVKTLVKNPDCSINPKAMKSASDCFGWGYAKIKKAIGKLKGHHMSAGGHFYKTEQKYDNPEIQVDYYKAKNLMDGEDVFIHLRVENDVLVICSFKRL